MNNIDLNDSSVINTSGRENIQPVSGKPFILLALPLIIYPGVFIASIMSLAGEKGSQNPGLLFTFILYAFLLGSLIYPLVYIFCLISFYLTKNNEKKALLIKILRTYLFTGIILLALGVIMEGLGVIMDLS